MENQTNETATLGSPNAEATHWTISRMVNGKPQRLDHPDDAGVRVREWPIPQLSIAVVRERWGAGTYKCHYHRIDPDAEEAIDRRRPLNAGPVFTLDPEPSAVTVKAPPAAVAPPMGDMSSALQFATALMQMSDQRSQATIQAVSQLAGVSRGSSDGGNVNADMLAKIAALEAKIDADRREREIQEAHRAELAAKDAEIAELRRRAEDAERDGGDEDGPATPAFQPGMPFLEQVGFALLNAAVSKPDLAAAVLAPIVEKFVGNKQETAPDSAPQPVVRTAPRRIVVSPPPPPVVQPSTVPGAAPSSPSDSWTPIGGAVPVMGAAGEPKGEVRVASPDADRSVVS